MAQLRKSYVYPFLRSASAKKDTQKEEQYHAAAGSNVFACGTA
jgi:hypothetical protein